MEILLQSLQTFAPPEKIFGSCSLHEEAIDLSLKPPPSTVVSLAISVNETKRDDQTSLLDVSCKEPDVDIEGDTDKDLLNDSYEEAAGIAILKKSLPQLDQIVELHCKVGEGTFSSVYLSTLRKNPSIKLAVKHLTPTCHPSRIKRELQCLKDIGGHDNVSGVLQCLRNEGCVVFIMPYQSHSKFQDIVLDMDAAEARLYMQNLLIALKRVHSFGIIHRDVKPGNFLYDRENKKFLLVDFGLAQSLDSANLKPKLPKLEVSNPKTEQVEVPVSSPIISNHKGLKRKFNEENSNLPDQGGKSPLKRQALQAQHDNIILPFKTSCLLPQKLDQFQLLVPTSISGVTKLPLHQQVLQSPSFVRVQNSRVKMFSAPLAKTTAAATETKARCACVKKAQICEICLKRRKLVAPRAGTPGFRPPEVLLKSLNQTTAVDMWSAGVLLLSILSGCYPFFRSPDDMTALSELMTVFGSKAIREVAVKHERMLMSDKERPPLDLKKLCIKLRASRQSRHYKSKDANVSQMKCPICGPSLNSVDTDVPCLCPVSPLNDHRTPQQFPDEAYDLLYRLLDLNSDTRITAEQALKHPFFEGL